MVAFRSWVVLLAATAGACTIDGNGGDDGLFGGGPSSISAAGQDESGGDDGAPPATDESGAASDASTSATGGDAGSTGDALVDTGGSEGVGDSGMVSDSEMGGVGSSDSEGSTGAGGMSSSEGDGGESSTGEVDVGTQPASGEYSHCLSNAACNVGSCLTLGVPVSDGICALTCGAGGSPVTCGDAPPASPLSPTCYGADNGVGGAIYVCVLGCAGDQPCPDGMECVSVPQAAAAGGGNLEFCA